MEYYNNGTSFVLEKNILNRENEQPGMEYKMNPLPVFDNPDYICSNKLAGKVAIITGGDSGIGRAIAVAFAKEGADISIVYYNEDIDAKYTKSYIESLGKKCLLISGDLRDKFFCKQCIEDTFNFFGRIDIVVNNAGVAYPQSSIENITDDQLYNTFAINVFSYFNMTKFALPYLKRGSTIINTASSTAYASFPAAVDYSATKGAIVSFTRSLALLLVDSGIRVNAVAPGITWTPLIVATSSPETIKNLIESSPMKRMAQPYELAPTYVYLASDDSSYVTGQVLHVDGGSTTSS